MTIEAVALNYTAPLPADAIDKITLSSGSHGSREAGLCAMELVAWLAGEKHSDAPQCACPVIRNYVVNLNDRGPQWLRDELKVRALKIVGTRASVETQKARARVFAGAAIRSAEIALPIFEAKYPNDNRPRIAIEKAKEAIASADAAADNAADAAAAAAADAAATADAADAARAADKDQHWRIALAALDAAIEIKYLAA